MRKLIMAVVAAAALAVPSAASADTAGAAPCNEPLAECVERFCEQALSNCPLGLVDRICQALADCPIDDVQGFCRRVLDNCPLAAAPATRSGTSADAATACQTGETYSECAVRITVEIIEKLYCTGSCVPGCSSPLSYCVVEKAREACAQISRVCS